MCTVCHIFNYFENTCKSHMPHQNYHKSFLFMSLCLYFTNSQQNRKKKKRETKQKIFKDWKTANYDDVWWFWHNVRISHLIGFHLPTDVAGARMFLCRVAPNLGASRKKATEACKTLNGFLTCQRAKHTLVVTKKSVEEHYYKFSNI